MIENGDNKVEKVLVGNIALGKKTIAMTQQTLTIKVMQNRKETPQKPNTEKIMGLKR
jgi:hypothetical protein